MTKAERGFDNFNMTSNNVNEFLKFLEEREQNTERYELPSNEVKFFTIEQSLKYYKTEDALAKRLAVSSELLEDTKANTDIVVAFNKKAFLLGSSAWVSLKNRMNIYGGGFDRIGPELQVAVLNKRFSQQTKTAKIIVVDDKVRAVMSDEYAVVPTADLFRAVLEKMEERFGKYEFVIGFVDHNVSRCKILLNDMKLNETYGLPDAYNPGLIIETSDTGFSANKIGPYWQMGKASFININEYIYMEHRGRTDLDKVLAELPNVFLKYQNTLKKFATLMQIKLNTPIRVLKKACKHIGLPKKITKQIVAQFEINYANVPEVTAYDLCREILFAPQYVDDIQKTSIEEKVGKAINLDYLLLDGDDE